MKILQTEVTEFGYLESGPTDGFPVLMLHGFPDGALTWERVVAHLEDQPLRLIRPYHRGYGPGRDTVKNAEGGSYAALGRYAKQQAMTHEEAPITVSVTFIGGENDHCTPPALYRRHQKLFTAGSRWMELPNTGHFVPREQPEAVAREIVSHLRWRGILPGS